MTPTTPILMKCFKRMVLAHIKNKTAAAQDKHQLPALHTILTDIHHNSTYDNILSATSGSSGPQRVSDGQRMYTKSCEHHHFLRRLWMWGWAGSRWAAYGMTEAAKGNLYYYNVIISTCNLTAETAFVNPSGKNIWAGIDIDYWSHVKGTLS